VIGRTIGRYRVVSKLGHGGLATVWKARDELRGREVALKLLHEHLASVEVVRRRFLHEATIAAALDHPGIVAVHDFGSSDGTAFIALALVEGETASESVARRLTPFAEVVRIGVALADALQYAHDHGVVHRDVTGRNIMLARDGRVLLLDFGLALADWESRLTSKGTRMGTAHYMASELIRGEEADARSDVYGLGVVLYELLTGGFPFTSEHPEGVMYAVANLPPVPPRARRADIPPAFEALVLHALARERAERPPSARALGQALAELRLEAASPARVAPNRAPATADEPTRDFATTPAARARLSGPHYLAILPFEVADPGTDPEGAAPQLADRLADTVSCALAKASGVRVVPASREALALEPRDAARELGANLLLRGSVRRSGMQLRVSWSVRDPWSGVSVAGDVVDGSALRVFDVEDEVVASVFRGLGLDPPARDAPAARPHDPAAEDHYRQAVGYLRRYDNEASIDGAIALLERLVATEGEQPRVLAALTRAYLYKSQLTRERVWENRAAKACERAIALEPDAAEVRLAVGHLHLVSGRPGEARQEFEHALGSEAVRFEARLGIARAHADSGRLAEAEVECARAIEERPDDWRAHSLLGWVHLHENRFAESLAPCRRVLELTPDNARGRRNLGTALYRLDRFEEAVEAFQQSLAIQPNDEAYSNLGAAFYALGRYEEAIEAFRTAVRLTVGDPLRWGNLGVACHWVAGHEHEAVVPLERAIGLMRERLERNPLRADWWALLSGWLVTLGRHAEAREAIERAITLDAGEAEVMLRAGHVYFEIGERGESLRWFRQAKAAGCGLGELRRSPALAALREDPEFLRLLESDPAGAQGGGSVASAPP
jgi:serine/threonine-protein kinase